MGVESVAEVTPICNICEKDIRYCDHVPNRRYGDVVCSYTGMEEKMRATSKGMIHLNGDICCAVDTETTGLRSGYHEMIQLAIVPLTFGFEVDTTYTPFVVLIKPEYPNRMDPKAMQINGLKESCMAHGLDKDVAIDHFMRWFDGLKLAPTGSPPFHKRIAPLVTNWKHDGGFIESWLGLGDDHVPYLEDYFDYHVRDLAPVANYLNDVAYMHNEDIPYPKQSLSNICTRLGIEHANKHDALGDCMALIECYKRVIKLRLPPQGIDFGN